MLKTPRYETKRAMRSVSGPEEFKNFAIEIKSLDDAKGEFEGYLAYFGNEDYNGDIIEKGAFSKTLREAKEVQNKNKAQFIFPLLWMHQEDQPVGGYYDMSEDDKGLYVKGRADMDVELGKRAFSGMQKGYMAQQSIGYDTVKATRDQKGVRHLLEVRLWEGSVITTGYAANPQANITSTKLRAMMEGAKSACGKTSWPLGDRDTAWDNSAAHGRIVAWATKDDGSLDETKMKSVHLYVDDSASDKITSYKLLFCDKSGDDIKAMPRAIMACSGSHGVEATTGVSDSDKVAIKSKLSTLYKRMAKQFDDETLIAPWDQKKARLRKALKEIEQKQWGGLATLVQGIAYIDQLADSIDIMFEMLGDATGMQLDPDDDDPNDVGAQQAGGDGGAGEVQPAVALILKGLKGFSALLQATGDAFDVVDSNIDELLGMLGVPDTDDDDYYNRPYLGGGGYYGGYGSRHDSAAESKTGAEFSAKNSKNMTDMAESLEGHATKLRDMVAKDEKARDYDEHGYTAVERWTMEQKSRREAAAESANGSKPEPVSTSTNPTGEPSNLIELTPQDEDEFSSLMLTHRIGLMNKSANMSAGEGGAQ